MKLLRAKVILRALVLVSFAILVALVFNQMNPNGLFFG
jgi:hypothetical protein